MAIRTDFTAGEVLAAADLNDTFGAKLNLAGGKILQIVRATDATDRTTTSATFVDASISVTITPQKSDSAVLLIGIIHNRTNSDATTGNAHGEYQITDNSNNAINGGEAFRVGAEFGPAVIRAFWIPVAIVARDTPATTSAKTYKIRFRNSGGSGCSINALNASNTGQLFAIEVSA